MIVVPKHTDEQVDGASHQPLLLAALAATTGPVLELGAGPYSTALIAHECHRLRRFFLAVDNSPIWAEKARSWGAAAMLTDDWLDAAARLADAPWRWGVTLIDLAPGELRRPVLNVLRNKVDVAIVHDTEPEREYAYHFDENYWESWHCLHDKRRTPWATAVSNSVRVDQWLLGL